MDDASANTWMRDHFCVPRETWVKIEEFVSYLSEENQRQNLVSTASLGSVWSRHIADSAQLLRFADTPAASWLDLGTGAGFPGLIVATFHEGPVTLVEARPLRIAFLEEAAQRLGIADRVTILCSKVERVETKAYDIISARAFAPLGKLLTLGHRFSTGRTRWILPKGRNAASELEEAGASWQGSFRLERSLTDDEAGIIVAEGVQPKTRKGAR